MKKIVLVNQDITFEEAFEKFLSYKRIMNVAEDTIKYYYSCKNMFCKFFDGSRPCKEINKDIYLGYIKYLKEKTPPIKDITMNTYLRGLRAILNFFIEDGLIENFKMPQIRQVTTIKDVYTDEELQRLLAKPNLKQCSFIEYRTWVATNVLIGTGMRISSLLSIQIKDLDLESREVVLRKTKNKKQYTIPIPIDLVKVLREYLLYRNGSEEDYLICSQYGQQLKTRSFQDNLKDYNLNRRVTKTSAHLYRHVFAKMWIMNGGDIFRLQRILGHSSLEMVNKYLDLYGKDLHNSFDDLNALSNLNRTNRTRITMKH